MVPRRRVVERTLGRLMRHRHLARDYETRPHRSKARRVTTPRRGRALVDSRRRRRTPRRSSSPRRPTRRTAQGC
ncbi:hypothetical protein BOG92_054165 [Streptomyces sp. WAC00263]|nr:hypothetical protein BOG92_054165 [Streptomyces sp. WAC00263]